MTSLDYAVLVGYFLLMTAIGLLSMLAVKKQEDFFLGSRTFGRLFQTFAAFGAGTGSQDPVAVGRTTYTSGLSGIWSVLLWLFVTPFYWLTAVWYRRMRHITLGDWFVERFQSKGLGFAFMLFAVAFYAVYLALGFNAIGKVGTPLVGVDQIDIPGLNIAIATEKALVYVCAAVVLIYGVLGGLRAAYWTDLIQGFFIILLSVLLIPAGLQALVDKTRADKTAAEQALQQQNLSPAEMAEAQAALQEEFGNTDELVMTDGFRIMHERVPAEYFNIIQTPRRGEFPLHYIIAITLLNLVAVVVHPHMAATGGGSAKTENSARVGLVTGNFLKRFCTIGWSITILIVLALMADNVEIAKDPSRAWGVAAREILSPDNLRFNAGLIGLMLSCLMAALMSSASCYMLVVSALVVRNFYAAYINPNASERASVLLGRIVSVLVILGGVFVALQYEDIFEQLKVAWEMPILFASVFWIGMFWRRATKWAAWATVLFTLLAFFAVPWLLPLASDWLAAQNGGAGSLRDNQEYAVTNDFVTTVVSRPATASDVAKREADIAIWPQKIEEWTRKQKTPPAPGAAEKAIGPCPKPLALGELTESKYPSGGDAAFWTGGVLPVDEQGQLDHDLGKYQETISEEEVARDDEAGTRTVEIHKRFRPGVELRGQGRFNVDFLLYKAAGMDLAGYKHSSLQTLRLPTRVVLPFLVMIVFSLVTPRVDRAALDRFYVKMKTPVVPDPEADRQEMEASYADPQRFDHRRLLPILGLEMQRPKLLDIVGFVVCFVICFALIWVTVLLANLGA